MKLTSIPIVAFQITEVPQLDSILVMTQDFGGGAGRIIIECYHEAWSAFWGGMGGDKIAHFVATCEADYVASKLWPSKRKHTKFADAYLLRIVMAVQEALKSA